MGEKSLRSDERRSVSMNKFEIEKQKRFNTVVKSMQAYITFIVTKGKKQTAHELAVELNNVIQAAIPILSWKSPKENK